MSRRFRKRPVLTGIFALALVLSVVFGVRLVLHGLYWADPAHRDETIAGWMTPGYVAHSWHVPNQLVGDALGFTKETFQPGQTLDELAKARGVPVEALKQALYSAITDHRAQPHD
ncbi:hypothetical protein [Tropicibacter sp. S64]|uniref:hypothetical protein n=1 Tax=Tropicibacter sp. S64 TaxID=3415122 RepID=UPI003C7BF10A